VWIMQRHVRRLLEYVEDARILLGELPNEHRGRYDLLSCAWPGRDRYDTPLRKKRR